MTSEIKSNLYPCAHCQETGTCSSGEDNTSCNFCIKRSELKKGNHVGLVCSICGGIGQAEPMTERMNKRITPILSLIIVLPLLGIISYSLIIRSEYFTEVLGFSSAIIGTIIGFYFSAASNK